jgi:pyruvate dehydrogenase E1 component alpha subunit
MHIFSKSTVYGGHGIVGGQTVGAGLAFADKYFETGGVMIPFDGCSSPRFLTRSFNMQCYGNYQSFYR